MYGYIWKKLDLLLEQLDEFAQGNLGGRTTEISPFPADKHYLSHLCLTWPPLKKVWLFLYFQIYM